jgi:hypothetical protein
LEAEEIRDAIMTASGQLDLTIGGPTHTHVGRLGVPDQGRPLNAEPWHRRSLYLPVYRGGFVLDLFQVFDFPDSGLVTGSRNATTVPTQSLFLMNSPFVMDQAQHVAKRFIARPGPATTRVRSLYASLLSREPTCDEEQRAVQFLADYAAACPKQKGNADEAAWAALSHALMACNEFRYLD